MKTGTTIVGLVVAAAIGGVVGYAIKDSDGEGGSKPTPIVADGAKPSAGANDTDTDVFKVPVGDSHQKGPSDALVTIVEFSDFQCPFCAKVLPTLEKIEAEYGKDVRIAFKHNPLPFHREAPLASEYVLAAGEQGKFWEMHDMVFANQRQLKKEDLDGYAEKVGLDMTKLQAFIDSGKGKSMIAEDQKLARQIGAGGTPAFFINGVKLSGAQPYPSFEKVIDERLAAAKKLVDAGTSRKDVYAKIIAGGRTSPPPPKAKPNRPQQDDSRKKIDLVDTSPSKGGKAPLVTIVEFSDYQCPFCTRVNPTLAAIQKKYGEDVQIRFRNQPLSFHKRALPAAQAALAAGKQGKFWEMHDKLFANQKALEDEDLTRYAKELGLNVAKFEKDMASAEVAKIIKRDQADAARYGARGTPTLFVNGVPVRGAQPLPRFEAIIDEEIALAKKLMKEGVKRSDVYAKILEREANKPSAARPAAPAAPAKPVDIDLGRAPIEGKKTAPVQVIMYSDFQCPFCSRVNPSIEQIKKEYGDKVVVAFKHYPLPFHKDAKLAAVASLAAHRQGKFWEMHDTLFENQRALKRDDLIGYAQKIGLDAAKFKKDLDDPALAKWVDEDMKEGASVGVRGTPATFINGRLVSGAQPFPAFKSIIDEELGNS